MKPKRIDGAFILTGLLGLAFLGVLLYSCGCASFNRVQSHVLAFERPNIDCVEVNHKVGDRVHEWGCPAPPHAMKHKLPYGCPKGQHIETAKDPEYPEMLILTCKLDPKP